MKRRDDGPIPAAEMYRGIPIHDCQPQERIDGVVKPEIDKILATTDLSALFVVTQDVTYSPEARLLAASLLEARHQIAAADRRVRPEIDLEVVHAATAGLNSRKWRSPWAYGSLLDVPAAPGEPGAVRREVPLEDEG